MLIKNGEAKGCGVYCIKTMQGKIYYIGGTKNLCDAYSRHKANLINGSYAETNKDKLQKKFNEEDLIFTVLENCSTEEQDKIETKYIKLYWDTLLNRDTKGKHRKTKSTPEETAKRREVNSGTKNPHNTKLSVSNVVDIKHMLLNGIKEKEIAEKYDISTGFVYNIKAGRRWSSITLNNKIEVECTGIQTTSCANALM